MNLQTRVKNKQENGIFLSSTVGQKRQNIVVTHTSTPIFCRHSLKLLSPTLPKLMNWILCCHYHTCPPTLTHHPRKKKFETCTSLGIISKRFSFREVCNRPQFSWDNQFYIPGDSVWVTICYFGSIYLKSSPL